MPSEDDRAALRRSIIRLLEILVTTIQADTADRVTCHAISTTPKFVAVIVALSEASFTVDSPAMRRSRFAPNWHSQRNRNRAMHFIDGSERFVVAETGASAPICRVAGKRCALLCRPVYHDSQRVIISHAIACQWPCSLRRGSAQNRTVATVRRRPRTNPRSPQQWRRFDLPRQYAPQVIVRTNTVRRSVRRSRSAALRPARGCRPVCGPCATVAPPPWSRRAAAARGWLRRRPTA